MGTYKIRTVREKTVTEVVIYSVDACSVNDAKQKILNQNNNNESIIEYDSWVTDESSPKLIKSQTWEEYKE
jgi:hypothetical protein